MSETTINQRLNFLLKELGMKAGPFARALDLSETTIRNYVDRTAKPSSEVLEKIVTTFKQVNLVWLVTGDGEPFLDKAEGNTTQTGNFNQAGTSNKQTIKGNIQNNTGSHSAITNTPQSENCQQALTATQKELEAAQKEIEYLRAQLGMKDLVIEAKDDNIALLKKLSLLRSSEPSADSKP